MKVQLAMRRKYSDGCNDGVMDAYSKVAVHYLKQTSADKTASQVPYLSKERDVGNLKENLDSAQTNIRLQMKAYHGFKNKAVKSKSAIINVSERNINQIPYLN